MKTAIILSLLTALLTACGPSCEQQGGKLEFQQFIYVTNYINGVMYLTLVPVYDCKLPKDSK